MNKKALMVGFVMFVAAAWCVSAYAGDGAANSCPIHGFFESVGGFLYNALPWNWGNWAGK